MLAADLNPAVAEYRFEPLKKGRRCGVDAFGFFLTFGDHVSPAQAVPSLPAAATDERKSTIERLVSDKPSVAGVHFWTEIATEIVSEARKQHRAVRSDADAADSTHSSTQRSTRNASAMWSGDKLSPWGREALLKARRRVRRGALPMEERRVAWQLLTGALFKPVTAAEYGALQAVTIAQESEEVMQRDLGRTLPLHCLFKDENSPGQRALSRVLHAYCARDPEVGYCQGMGFIASMLLLHMDEPAAFGVLWQLMHGRHFLMRQLYQQGFPLLQKMLEILRGLLRRFLPRLHNHFCDLAIEPAFYASHWFLTLYAYQFPVPLVCRIWDLFISEGWKIVFKVAVALLQWEEHQLLGMSMESVLLLLKTIHENKDPEAVIRRAMSLPIKERDLHYSEPSATPPP